MSSATKSKVSAMVSGAGMAADVWTRLDREVKAQGGTDDDLHLLARVEGQGMISQIAATLVRAGATTRNAYPVTIDYDQSLADMIAAGKYDWKNEDITAKNFPMQGNGAVNLKIVLIHPNRNIESEDSVREQDQIGLRPATLPELLAYGAKYPETQREFPIVALGSSWVCPHGYRSVPYLSDWDEERDLCLGDWDGAWGARYRFLAVRK
jgi:hypothetical protein